MPVQAHDEFEIEVLPQVAVEPYSVYENDKDVYRKVNDLIDPDDPRVAALADQVSEGLGNEYNLYWIAALFDWVISELEYQRDPSEGDEWAPPGQTCDSLAGDCEDYAILLASVVEHWGGNAQFYIITKHAFAGVYIGPRTMDVNAVVDALDLYYGTSPYFSWFVDDLGYWIIADGTSGQYLGGLPYGGVATDNQGGWDIDETEYLYITDIYPGYPE
jgi:transglutaminase-like putative cysteine protease